MYPHLFTIGNFTITSFGVMMFLSFVVGAWFLAKQLDKRGQNPEIAWDVLLWVAVGGILGAKLYFVALHPAELMANPFRALTNRGGLVWYGGFIGGVLAFWWQLRRRKLPMALMFDAVAPTLAISYAVGRIGCFLVGDDYGRPTDSWVGIAFPEGYPPTTAGYFRSIGYDISAQVPDAAVLAVHPTQLYEITAGLIMFAILWRLSGKLRVGRLFAVYLVLYGIERFAVEFVRAKTDHVLLGLTTSQLMSVVILIIAAIIWQRTTNAPRPDFGDAAGGAGKSPSAAGG